LETFPSRNEEGNEELIIFYLTSELALQE